MSNQESTAKNYFALGIILLAFLINIIPTHCFPAAQPQGKTNLNLASYPSPDEDGTFFSVDLSDPPQSEFGRSDENEHAVKFYLYTNRENLGEEEHEIRIDEENPAWLPFFHENATTLILCHGYKSSHEKPFPAQLKTISLLGNSVNVNVVVVGWETLANSSMVQSAVKNMRVVGEKTVEMLSYVYRFSSLDFRKIHFIGHNLGAHIGGIVGETLQRSRAVKLGRITGLDPANVKNCNDFQNLLDKTDAEFVDAIHTDDATHDCEAPWRHYKTTREDIVQRWGSRGQVGHVDFYPKFEHSTIAAHCGHCRSYKIFTKIFQKNLDQGKNFPLCNCANPDCKCRLN